MSWQGLAIYKDALSDVVTGRPPAELIDPVSKYLLEHTNDNDKVLVWGAQAGIYFMSRTEASTAYFLYPMFVPSEAGNLLNDQFLADLKAYPPTIIADVYYYVGGNELCYSLDPVIRAQQYTISDKYPIIFTAYNIEQVFQFIEQNYHLEDRIGEAYIYHINP
jgi:hypothetical protein